MNKKLSKIAIIYFVIGIIFAFCFALYYKWSALSYFSPGFWVVIITWPYQAIGFIQDLMIYGFTGKPIF